MSDDIDNGGKGGITRRDMMKVMAASGMMAAGAGGLLMTPGAAFAAPAPKRGGKIRVANEAGSTADTLDPASLDGRGLYPLLHVLQRPHAARCEPDAADEPRRIAADDRCEDLDHQAAQGRHVSRRQAGRPGRRGVLADAPQEPGHRVEGQDACRAVHGREGERPRRSHVDARQRERGPAGDPRDAAARDRQGRHDRLLDRHRLRPVQAEVVRRACRPSACATTATSSRASRISTRSS